MGKRILFVGESWMSYGIHVKGFNNYTTGSYEEGGGPLINALGAMGHEVAYVRNHEVVSCFPDTVDELKKYDVVILSDVGADTFLLHPETFTKSKVRPNRLRLIADFVADGGGLLMVGGYMSFSGFEGKAHYGNTALADVLPVEMLGYDDRIELPEGVTPTPVATHAILEGLTQWPHFLGYNRFKTKDGANVLMKANNDPFLVLGTYGQGRAAAFASDCSPHWGTPEFVNWEGYPRFWSNLIEWLGKSE